MWRYDYLDSNNFWPFGSFINVLCLALIICTIVYLSKMSSKRSISEEPKKQDEAMDILRKRYAAGEINAEEFAQKKKAPVLAVYDVGSLEAIKKFSSITLDAEGKILFFEEKPKNPTSTLTGIALYYYPREVVELLDVYIKEGNNPDQPGRFIQWLYPRIPVYTWRVPGVWYDIGSKETLEEADRNFSKGTI